MSRASSATQSSSTTVAGSRGIASRMLRALGRSPSFQGTGASPIAAVRLAAGVSLALVVAALAWAPSAGAVGYAYAGAFGEAGAGAGQFADPNRIAVDSTTGNVFVADTGNDRVQAFEPGDCAPVCASPLLSFAVTDPLGIAVDSSTGEVYTTHAGVNEVQSVAIAGASSGSYTLTFGGETATLAFNANAAAVQTALQALSTIGAGNVTVAGAAGNNTLRTRVVTFTGALASTDVALLTADASGLSAGATVTPTTTTAGEAGSVSKFAPDDHLAPASYSPAVLFSSPAVTGIAPSGASTQTAPAIGGIAVDPDGGDLLLTLGKAVGRFSSAGVAQGSPFDGTPDTSTFNTAADIAVDAGGDLIVADIVSAAAVRILRFGPDGTLEATLTPAPANPNAAGRRVAVAADALNGAAFATSTPTAVNQAASLCQYEADTQTGCLGTPTPSSLAYVRGLAASGTEPARLYTVAFDNSGGFDILPGPPTIHVFEESQPPKAVIDPVDVETVSGTAAELSGTVDPNDATIAACRFEVVTAAQHSVNGFSSAQHFACDSTPSGDEPVPVAAVATGLEPATAYRVRLSASTTGGLTGVSEVEDFATVPVLPVVMTGKAWSVSDTAATLAGTVNPRNTPTTYRFEYVTEAEHDANGFSNAASTPEADAGQGGTAVEVIARIDGLEAGAPYLFRIVADNGTQVDPDCETDCATLVEGDGVPFASRSTVVLPERGYELVSAFDTNGINAHPNLASADGRHFVYITYIASPGAKSGLLYPHFRASRSAGGEWSQAAVGAPPPPAGQPITSEGPAPIFSRDLGVAAFGYGQSLDPDDQNGVSDAYVDSLLDGELTWISRNPAIPPGEPQTEAVDANAIEHISADGRRVFFRSQRHLLPNDPSSSGALNRNLYLWERGQDGGPSQLSLVGIPPGDTSGFATGGSTLGSGTGDVGRVTNAASDDGSRIVFQNGSGSANTRLYIRLDGETTTEVSASAPGVSPPVTSPFNVRYVGADANQRYIFFTSASRLTTDSEASNTNNGAADLYRYDVDGETLANVTPHVAGGAGVLWTYAISDDGKRVYFSSNKQIDGHGTAGGHNLFLTELDDGESAPVHRFIATVSDEAGGFTSGLAGSNAQRAPAFREVSATATGSVLAFRSTVAHVPGLKTGGHPQVYVYEAQRGDLSCISCPQDGTVPAVQANLTPTDWIPNFAAGELVLSPVTLNAINSHNPHAVNVTTGGSVFFQTATSLVAEDTNGVHDVYEWRGGHLQLVSSGTGSQVSTVGSASADGSTVFLRTADAMAPGVAPGTQRIWAACEIGVVEQCGRWRPPTEAAPCQSGDGCRGMSAAAPNPSLPVTDAFAGRSNVPRSTRKALALRAPSRAQRRRAARTGRVPVRVRLNRAGVVRLLASARVGRRHRRVARSSIRVRRAGTTAVVLRLDGSARRALRGGKALRLTVQASSPGARARTATIRLPGGRS